MPPRAVATARTEARADERNASDLQPVTNFSWDFIFRPTSGCRKFDPVENFMDEIFDRRK